MEIISNSTPEPSLEGSDELKITKISLGVKNPHRVNIFINDKYDFSLTLEQLADYKLKEGQVISDEDLERFRHASSLGKLYQNTLEWILLRPRSVKEARDHLRDKKYKRKLAKKRYDEYLTKRRTDPDNIVRAYQPKQPGAPISDDDIEQVIAKLLAVRALDDARFVETYIDFRNRTKGTSLKKIRLELMKKGIKGSVIDEALSSSDRSDAEEIQKIIEKKRRRYPDNQKLLAYLVRQGFSYDLARSALDL
jgi:regulatory protein